LIIFCRSALAGAARFDVGVLDRGVDQAERRQAQLVLRLHRVLDAFVDLLTQHRFRS
jgi:hypothetical protein